MNRANCRQIRTESTRESEVLGRRAFIGRVVTAASALALPCYAQVPGTSPAGRPGRELIRDRHFHRGFFLLEPKPGQRVVYGRMEGLRPRTRHEPVWDLAQWSSRCPLQPQSARRRDDGAIELANEAKSVVIGQPKSEAADLTLGVNASVEYGNKARRKEDPWVHLLVQQTLPRPPSVERLSSVSFQVAARLRKSRQVKTDDYSPDVHAAQMQMFLSIQNRNARSAGHGEYLWFGLPFYDNRHRMPPAYKAQDFGDTKMFIYTCAAEDLTKESTHDGGWVTMEKDLLPLIHEGMDTAWSRGFLDGSKQLADYAIAGVFLGWEVPGIFDVEMQLRDLSLQCAS